ncbi:hypothetical protein niasHS_006807 [Heterodera schachtii]|uniref:Rho-GAP domain-containing protein n=1 Tax=Heterodera schachtii TaxID=97005 RepID=A0ABD2JIG0_HETSC
MSRKSLADFAPRGAFSAVRPRRSLSATRSLTDSTVQFVGRIGASLRIAPSSARRRQSHNNKAEEELSSLDSAQFECPKTPTPNLKSSLADHWFRTIRLRRRSIRFGNERQQQQQKRGEEGTEAEEEVEETEMVALFPSHSFLGDCEQRNGEDQPSDQQEKQTIHQNDPQNSVQRRYLKEGPCQLTSILSLSHHHRYLFLFNDLLLVCKQKGENSYKLKEKVALQFLWLSANNCTHSFLIGWPPTRNYIAHFSSEREKSDWFDKLSTLLKQNLSSKSTTVGVFVQIEGRHQFIRKEVFNGRKADELLEELRDELHLPVLDPHLGHYELCFCPGQSHKIARALPPQSPSVPNSVDSPSLGPHPSLPSPGILRRVHSHSSIAPQQNNTLRPFHGVENVYAVLMDFVRNQLGLSLSDSQLAHLDTCPLVNCRLVLRQNGANNPSHSHHKGPSAAAMSLVHQFRRVLGRADSSSAHAAPPPCATGGNSRTKRLFGRQLRGTMPPQPVLTMIDHLLLYGSETEGIFRKSPKQQTVRILRQQLDQGQVPDFHQFNVHVTASLLKEYLRCIPGQLLISGNYRLWMEANGDGLSDEQRICRCRKLLAMLPPAHTVLLRSVLRLLRRVAANEEHTKMGINALAVCVAPSLLEKLDDVDSVRLVPELVIFLVRQAPALLDGFLEDGPLLFHHPQQQFAPSSSVGPSPSSLHQSTDSGLSEVGANASVATTTTAHAMGSKRRVHGGAAEGRERGGGGILRRRVGSVSPDSGKLSSDDPASDEDDDDATSEEGHHPQQQTPPFGHFHNRDRKDERQRWLHTHSLDVEELEGLGTAPTAMSDGTEDSEEGEAEEEKTPVALSRENSDVKDGAKPAHTLAWHHSHCPTRNEQQKQQQNGISDSNFKNCTNFPESEADSQRVAFGSVREGICGAQLAAPSLCSFDGFDCRPNSSRKVSTTSLESGGSASSGGGIATLSRRALITTSRDETLGLSGKTGGVAGGAKNILISRQNLVNSSAASAAVARGIARRHGRLIEQQAEANNLVVAKSLFPRVQQQPLATVQSFSPTNVCRPPWTPQTEKRRLIGAKDFVGQNSFSKEAASNNCHVAVPSVTPNLTKVSALSSEVARRCSTSALCANGSSFLGKNDGILEESTKSAKTPQKLEKQSHLTKYIPPKRTAEELLLDKLEVNWSVPQIRKTFQRNTEVKPIDTVYAKLPTAGGGKGGAVTARK